MADPKKKTEQDVVDTELENDLEFSATTAVMDLTKDIKKALGGQGGAATPPASNFDLDDDIVSTADLKKAAAPQKTVTPGRPAAPQPNGKPVPGAKPQVQSRPAASTSAPPGPTSQRPASSPASELEKVIEAQVMKAISKMGNVLPMGGTPAATGNPDLDRRIQLEVFKAVDNINREHAQRNKDLEMEIYSILRKYANHPDFASEFDQIMRLLADHSNVDKKFKKTG